ncbi:redoxin domain-containing protein [Roseiconus nitratireducens]|uniref:Redoxin domain-containing protein n=1 Tax=Roseiconus nitratireducens TaxID=2605748 RepID=A0A5M6DBB3_9BACT|nr:redoxin domain-containing protein [Roseiconus nitratireducens]KAA5543796.1 redoxin domain-containing protein [Roseiconus nitratireducens]
MASKHRAFFLFLFSVATFYAGVAPDRAIAQLAPEPPEVNPVLLQMIRDSAIHRELDLSAEQIDAVMHVLEEVDGPWFRVRIRPQPERKVVMGKLTLQLEQALAEILKPDQLDRLNQLRNQALGTRMIVRDAAVSQLDLASQKRGELFEYFAETDRMVATWQEQLRGGEGDERAIASKIQQRQNDERQHFVDSLTNAQKRTLYDLTGKSFDFQQVKRMYPRAPELTLEGAEWLQGGPLTLEQLRGKVVALHFYAFQCINCRRNLPHYNGWHTDYADQGLVVIGIQTPETSAERSVERVAAAIQSEGIEYPVLMDAESSNWKRWSNTMWPTVYLIDKQGFLRRWWQGELNWKETPGEKQMRETIETLLAEGD